MRKVLLSVFIVIVALSFAGLSFAAVSSMYEVAVVSMKGEVKVDTKGDGTWITPWVGMKLKKDASIKTGEGASISIVYDREGLNLLIVNENTELTVKDSMADLSTGTVTGDFANLMPGSTFTVKTPTAACGIRGTTFRVTLASGGKLLVELVNGKMSIQPLDAAGNPVGAPTDVPPGMAVDVKNDGTMTESELTEAEKEAVVATVEAVLNPDGAVSDEVTEIEEVADETQEDEIDTKDLDEEKEISPSS